MGGYNPSYTNAQDAIMAGNENSMAMPEQQMDFGKRKQRDMMLNYGLPQILAAAKAGDPEAAAIITQLSQGADQGYNSPQPPASGNRYSAENAGQAGPDAMNRFRGAGGSAFDELLNKRRAAIRARMDGNQSKPQSMMDRIRSSVNAEF